MQLGELTPFVPIAAPIIGVAGTILGLVVWLLRSHIQNKDERIKHLEGDKRELELEAATAEARARSAEVERDAASPSILVTEAGGYKLVP